MTIKANQAFVQFVNSTMSAERISYAAAWQRASQLKPDLNILMLALGATRERLQFFNSKHASPTPASRIEARTEFHAKVHAHMAKSKVDYDTADRACRREFANLAAQVYSGGGSGATAALHSDLSGALDVTPLANPGLLALFCLPSETAQEVFKAAYEANGKQSATINPAKIFDGLANYFMDKKSINHDAAISFCKAQFPELWAAVKKLAQP